MKGKCPVCGNQINVGERFCKRCGGRVPSEWFKSEPVTKKRKNSFIKGIIIGFSSVLILSAAIGGPLVFMNREEPSPVLPDTNDSPGSSQEIASQATGGDVEYFSSIFDLPLIENDDEFKADPPFSRETSFLTEQPYEDHMMYFQLKEYQPRGHYIITGKDGEPPSGTVSHHFVKKMPKGIDFTIVLNDQYELAVVRSGQENKNDYLLLQDKYREDNYLKLSGININGGSDVYGYYLETDKSEYLILEMMVQYYEKNDYYSEAVESHDPNDYIVKESVAIIDLEGHKISDRRGGDESIPIIYDSYKDFVKERYWGGRGFAIKEDDTYLYYEEGTTDYPEMMNRETVYETEEETCDHLSQLLEDLGIEKRMLQFQPEKEPQGTEKPLYISREILNHQVVDWWSYNIGDQIEVSERLFFGHQ